jgi:CHAD domain-containing protein
VEVAESSAEDLENFVEEMRKASDLQTAKVSKYEAGLSARELTPSGRPDLGPTETDKTSSAGELALTLMRKHFATFLDHEPGARLGEDAREIHQMRVAARRLRALMRMYRDYLPPQVEALRQELGWAADALGAVRDLDVQITRVNESSTDGGAVPAGDIDIQPVVALLAGERKAAHGRLVETLNSDRYEQFVTAFVTLLRSPADLPEAAGAPALEVVPDLIRRRYRKVRKSGDQLDETSPPADYHALRIQCKRLRYGLEFVPQYRKAAKKLISRLSELQDLLGSYQDVQVAVAQLRSMSDDSTRKLPAEVTFALGEVAQRFVQQGVDAKGQFPQAYADFTGKPWKRFKKAMRKYSP